MEQPLPLRRKLWQGVETFAVVSVITVLIWLYAEKQKVREDTITARVRLVSASSDPVSISPAEPQVVQLRLRFANSAATDVRQLAQEALEVPLELLADGPDQRVVLLERLERHPRLMALGVELSEVQPSTLAARVQPILERQLTVTVDPGELPLAAPPQAEPGLVTVRGPADAVQRLNDHARALVSLAELPGLAQLPPNAPHTQDLPVRLPVRNGSLTIEPSTVRVTFTVRNTLDNLTIPSCPLLLQLPPGALARYRVTLANNMEFLDEPVELSGPAEQIAQLRSDPAGRVYAVLRLSYEQLGSGLEAKAVEFVAPSGVRVLTSPPVVAFRVEPIDTVPREPVLE